MGMPPLSAGEMPCFDLGEDCSIYSECGACTERSGCGWCRGTRTCGATDPLTSQPFCSECTDYLTGDSQCALPADDPVNQAIAAVENVGIYAVVLTLLLVALIAYICRRRICPCCLWAPSGRPASDFSHLQLI